MKNFKESFNNLSKAEKLAVIALIIVVTGLIILMANGPVIAGFGIDSNDVLNFPMPW